ncbi:Allene oxide synthase [Musa troglodytarum]|uniref:Allene oxide synthase n=1 Tax=Musa troglodytarum TaxID=320322 RepID=A0A9E7KYF1_9LILI|nr:Allene oxide synthase [Musa troglodytarum]
MMVASHDGRFEVRAGEVLGEALLRHVLWSNGPETEGPTAENKQCAGKDFVVTVARLLVVELFLRYDSFEIEVGASPLGSLVKLTSLKRATF